MNRIYPLQDYMIGLMLLTLRDRTPNLLLQTLDHLHVHAGPQSGMCRLLVNYFVWCNSLEFQEIDHQSLFFADVIERLRVADEAPMLNRRVKRLEDWAAYSAIHICRYHAHTEIHAEIYHRGTHENIPQFPERSQRRSERTSRRRCRMPKIRRTRSEETFRDICSEPTIRRRSSEEILREGLYPRIAGVQEKGLEQVFHGHRSSLRPQQARSDTYLEEGVDPDMVSEEGSQ
ncbi:uncharacterized protein EI97DRAFT_303836 [Westerdykella ornata]|uniref:Uncharacterized protein n=1 Tax=Westerdykella ornata TaxID=318751 RepID=A0A6A6JK18_WESOR|nr:uncharacterized protein EI97DRAFT_303836 [Westerdykella ornata]KAF2276941.1 hypothetical protein EI97DRAFT_303836 [Westerdykella ornata]